MKGWAPSIQCHRSTGRRPRYPARQSARPPTRARAVAMAVGPPGRDSSLCDLPRGAQHEVMCPWVHFVEHPGLDGQSCRSG